MTKKQATPTPDPVVEEKAEKAPEVNPLEVLAQEAREAGAKKVVVYDRYIRVDH